MKYTRKLDMGGLVLYTPVLGSSPAMPTAPSGASGASAKKTEASSLLDEDLKKEIISKGGLSNDTNALIKKLMEIESRSANPFLQNHNRMQSLALIGQINELRQNKAMWRESYNIARSTGGLGEIAVGNSGEVYVKNESGEVSAMSLSEYKKNTGKVRALSVAELLGERNSNPLLVGQNNIFNVANNSVGISKISDYAQKVVKALGTETTKEERIYDRDDLRAKMQALGAEIQASGKNPTTEEVKGFAILTSLQDSPSRYNEVMSETKTARNHALKAVKYIWSTLGTNAQNKLAAQAAINGTDPSQMLLDLIIMGTDASTSTTVRPISEGKATTGSDSGGLDAKNTDRLTETQMLLKGTLQTGQRFIFNDPENASKFDGLIVGQMAFTTAKDNKPMGSTTLFGVLKQGEWERLVDTENIHFGNRKVANYQQNDIVFDGMSDITQVYLPVKVDGSPDNDSMAEFRKVMDQYKENKDNMSNSEIRRLFANSGFTVTINDDKTLDVRAAGSDVKPFLIAYGYTTEGSDLIKENIEDPQTKNTGGLRKLTGVEKDGMKSWENMGYTVGSGKNTMNLKPTVGFLNRFFTGTDRYKGIVYMPLRAGATATAAAMVGSGPRSQPVFEEQVAHNLRSSSNNLFAQTDISSLYE